MKILQNYKKCIVSVLAILFMTVSCTTTDSEAKSLLQEKKAVSSSSAKSAQKNSSSDDEKKKNATAAAEKAFIERIADLDFKITAAPKATTKHKDFASAYTVSIKDTTGTPVSDFPVTISWPSSRTNDTIVYSTKTVSTGDDGCISFMPETPVFSFDDKITFYPAPVSSEASVIKAAYDASVSAPFRVRTDFTKKNGIVYVFDYNEDGKVMTNSPYILREMINAGVKVGNSPISTSSYLSKPVESLYKATFNIVGNIYGFMVSGTIKYASPVTQLENGKYSCSLAADITCIDMSDGSVLYVTHQTETMEAESKYKVVDNCKLALSTKTARAVLYGM